MIKEIVDYFVYLILLIEIGLFFFLIYSLGVKIIERKKEKKDDKYKDIKE